MKKLRFIVLACLSATLLFASAANAQSGLRVGVGLRGGVMGVVTAPQGVPGVVMTVEGRLGRQFTSSVGVYGEGRVGFITGMESGSGSGIVPALSVGGIVQWNPTERFALAGGVGLGLYPWQICLFGNCSLIMMMSVRPTMRASYEVPLYRAIQSDGSVRRHALAISAEFVPEVLFGNNVNTFLAFNGLLGIGYEFYGM